MVSTSGSPITIFAGRSNRSLGQAIAGEFGKDLGAVTIKNFSDGEIYVRYEESIRGTDLFIIQSTHPHGDHWMELFLLIDAAKRASATRVTAVIPYFGYARQERKDQPRVSIAAKLMANMLRTAGIDRVLTMDLHASQIQGFFDVPVDHLYGSAVFSDYFGSTLDSTNLVVVAPDVGALKIARAYAKRLNAELAVIDKRRPKQNSAEVMNIIGEVDGKDVLLIDDIIDTAGSAVGAANLLQQRGALSVRLAASHGIMSDPAVDRIKNSAISEVVISNTLPVPDDAVDLTTLTVLSIGSVLAGAINAIFTDASVSAIFKGENM